MPNIVGQRGTASYGATGSLERKLDVSGKVFLLEPFNHPLITLLTSIKAPVPGVNYKSVNLKKRKVKDPEFVWFEDVYGGTRTTISAGTPIAANNQLTFSVTNASLFTKWDIIKIVAAAGEEQLRVTDVNTSTNVLTVTRNFSASGTALAAAAAGSYVYLLASASAEGASARDANTTSKTRVTNYCQIHRTPLSLTNTQINTEMWTGNELSFQHSKKAVEHALGIERSLWFGEKKEDLTGTQPIRTSGGILEEINGKGASFIEDANGALDESTWLSFLEKGFNYGSTKKYLFASGRILNAINGFARGNLRVSPTDKTYGITITTYQSPFGDVQLIRNPLFTQDYSDKAVLLDLDTVEYCFLRDTALRQNIQANDADGRIDEYLTEAGMARYNFEKNALLTGVTG